MVALGILWVPHTFAPRVCTNVYGICLLQVLRQPLAHLSAVSFPAHLSSMSFPAHLSDMSFPDYLSSMSFPAHLSAMSFPD